MTNDNSLQGFFLKVGSLIGFTVVKPSRLNPICEIFKKRKGL